VYRKPPRSIELSKYELLLYRLDTIGIAGFHHDFRSLHGERSEVYTSFESLTREELSMLDIANLLFVNIFPMIEQLPTSRKKLMDKLRVSLINITVKLLADTGKIGDQKPEDKSIIGLLRSFSIHFSC
jgi:hypothetical protein